MSFVLKFAVLGGDLRQAAVADLLASRGHRVFVWGLPKSTLSPKVTLASDWRDAVANADVLVLPLPASPDSRYLNVPLLQGEGEHPPCISQILKETPQGTLIAGGRFSAKIKEALEQTGHRYFDYFESEELKQKNAVPTAEGAIEVLMREVPRTVRGLSVAVTGYGRVSKALVSLLLAMGAKVTVMARKAVDLSHAKLLGCDTLLLENEGVTDALGSRFSVIFNTVPHCLFDARVLNGLSHETVIVDLASAPGGVDVNAAKALGIRAIWALSLPGKYAPVTAGEIIGETVLLHVRECVKGGEEV